MLSQEKKPVLISIAELNTGEVGGGIATLCLVLSHSCVLFEEVTANWLNQCNVSHIVVALGVRICFQR